MSLFRRKVDSSTIPVKWKVSCMKLTFSVEVISLTQWRHSFKSIRVSTNLIASQVWSNEPIQINFAQLFFYYNRRGDST